MKREEFTNKRDYVKDLIMGAMADDFENFEIIIAGVRQFASEDGEGIDWSEVPGLLKELIDEGAVQAFDLEISQKQPQPYSQERLHELWYYLSPKGMADYKQRHNITW